MINRLKQIAFAVFAGTMLTLSASALEVEQTEHVVKSSAPSSTDDITEGYRQGSIWIDTTGDGRIYQCVDATDGSAVWNELTLDIGALTSVTVADSDSLVVRDADDGEKKSITAGDLTLDIGGYSNVTASGSDKLVIEDADDNNNKKNVTAKSIAATLDIGALTSVTVASSDALVVRDASDGDKKNVTAQDIADLGAAGSAIELDLGDDGTAQSTDLKEIATNNDTNSIATEPTDDKLYLDMSKNWPTADSAAGLESNALDTIGEIDSSVRTGIASQLQTGSAGNSGNIPYWNSDGDLADAGVNYSSIITDGYTDVSGADWVLDEDSMASNSATKVPTQQSAKAYVDNNAGDDSFYGLIRYQTAAPTASDEVVYIDSDDGDTLKVYDAGSSSWVSISGSGGASSISELSDADSSSPSANDALLYDDANNEYANRQITESDISDLGSYLPLSGGTMTGQIVFDDDSSTPPTQWTLRSTAPDSPSAGDVYADDGSNTGDGNPGLRIYDGSNWYDMGGGGLSPGDKDRTFSFTIPDGTHDCIVQLKIDDNQDFSSEEVHRATYDDGSISASDVTFGETGWKIFDATTPEWLDMSAVSGTGIVPSGYRGNRVSYVFSDSNIEDGTDYYCAFRIKQDADDDGSFSDESWADWTGETKSW